jgi:hypothetical protein
LYSIEPAGRGRRTIRRLFPGAIVGLVTLLLVLAVLTSSHAVFPFFPLIPVVLFFFWMRMIGRTTAWRRDPPAIGPLIGDPPALPPNGIDKEKELLQVLGRHEEITATRAALETSLSVAEAEEMLSRLANDGHLRVSANEGRLVYALWD